MFRGLLVVVLAGLLAGCAGSGFKADKGGVASIKTVALISFSVPRVVAEEAGGGSLAGIMAMVGTAKSGMQGNGAVVARDAAAGFVEEIARQANLSVMPIDQVVANGEFKALVGQYDQTKGGQKLTRDGLAVIVLTPSMPQSEFAAKAAKALGVDGVMMVDVNTLNYFLYTGAVGSGQAKAKGSGMFKLFDRNGRAVWESGTVVQTDASGAMVAGGLNPAAAPILNKDIGTSMAKDLVKTYRGN